MLESEGDAAPLIVVSVLPYVRVPCFLVPSLRVDVLLVNFAESTSSDDQDPYGGGLIMAVQNDVVLPYLRLNSSLRPALLHKGRLGAFLSVEYQVQ